MSRHFCPQELSVVQKGTCQGRVKLLEAGPKSTWQQPHGVTFLVNGRHVGVHRPVERSISEDMPKLDPQQCSPVLAWKTPPAVTHVGRKSGCNWSFSSGIGSRGLRSEACRPSTFRAPPKEWGFLISESKHALGQSSGSLTAWVNCFRRPGRQDAKEATIRTKDTEVMKSAHWKLNESWMRFS